MLLISPRIGLIMLLFRQLMLVKFRLWHGFVDFWWQFTIITNLRALTAHNFCTSADIFFQWYDQSLTILTLKLTLNEQQQSTTTATLPTIATKFNSNMNLTKIACNNKTCNYNSCTYQQQYCSATFNNNKCQQQATTLITASLLSIIQKSHK